MKPILFTTAGVALLGFGLLTAAVKTDYDHGADFAHYKTYSWLRVDAADSLWTDRIKQAVDQQLSEKNLTRVDAGGDISITAMGRVRQQQTYETFYNGLGGGWRWRGFGGLGETSTAVEETPVGSLAVDMFDASTKKLVWRGTATDTLSNKPDKDTKKLDNEVANMFKKFPPKGES